MDAWTLLAAGAAGACVLAAVPAPGLKRLDTPAWRAWPRELLRHVGVMRLLGRFGAAGPGTPPRGRAGVRDRRLVREVPHVCELLAVCLEAGRPARGALRVVAAAMDGPTAEALRRVLAEIDLGVEEARAWAALGAVPGYRAVARDLARSVHTGVPLATLLRRHAADARREERGRAQVRARGAGVLSALPLVVCFLPAFLLLGVVPIFGAVAAGFLR